MNKANFIEPNYTNSEIVYRMTPENRQLCLKGKKPSDLCKH